MATASLSATRRTGTGKGVARTLRRDGKVPGVIYGHKREATPVAVDARDLEKLLERISADNTVIELAIEGAGARALIREIQRHPFKRQILHIDFLELVAGEKVTVNVPLVLVGTAAGVRNAGGVLDQIMREVQVEVDPANIPNHIDVDISGLELGGSVHVSEVPVPEGAEVQDEPSAAVVVIATPRAAIETPVGEEPTSAEPEVIRAKKTEEGEEK